MVRPDRHAQAAAQLVTMLADEIAKAQDHILRELAVTDGYPSGPGGDKITGGTSELTPVERAAEQRGLLRADLEQMREDVRTIATIAHSALTVARKAQRTRLVRTPPALCDGRSFEGADQAWTPHSRHPDNGWHDPNCREAADESGLCPRCRIRERRWRDEHGLNPRSSNAGNPAA